MCLLFHHFLIVFSRSFSKASIAHCDFSERRIGKVKTCFHKNINLLVYKSFKHTLTNKSMGKVWREVHCVKRVHIRSYFGQYFPAFGQNTERYSVSLLSRSKCGKIRNRITPNTNIFHAVAVLAIPLYGGQLSLK